MNTLLRRLRLDPYIVAIVPMVAVAAVILFHQMQLIVCAAVARRYSKRPEEVLPVVTAPA